MNLGELVDELRNNILRDVTTAVRPSGDEELWSTPSLIRYINDGVMRFATVTCCLRDETTPELTRITLVEGQEMYDLDSRVIAVLGVRLPGERHLGRTTYGAIYHTSGETAMGGYTSAASGSRGAAMYYTDRESGKIGLYPSPSLHQAGEELVLRIARKPRKLVASDLKAEPEIPEEYHLDILEWAAWRALRNHDTDIENIPKASMHKKRFEDATQELERQTKRLLAANIQFDPRNNWRR